MSDQRYREAALRRRYGMSPQRAAELRSFNEAQSDWTARCRVCGEVLQGTPAQLREHRHGPDQTR
jgi:hypothetical protein